MPLMQGFPPAPEDRATLANWRTQPFNAWAFHHVREVVPSAEIRNDPANVRVLPEGDTDLSAADLDAAINGMTNDALVILHKGKVVHESYRNGMTRFDPPILMSVSKSVLGLVMGTLVERGEVAMGDLLTKYLPEVSGTAYAGATVRHALDMQVGLFFEEDYTATDGVIVDYRKAANWNPLAAGDVAGDLRSFQERLTDSTGPHGETFYYASPVTDLLVWLMERATGVRFADLVSQRLFAPMGAETSGYITVDRIGAARGAGGMCLTARDLALVGQLMIEEGARDGVQIIPKGWIEDIVTNGDNAAWLRGDFHDKFENQQMHYRAKWYVHPGDAPLIHGLGIHGQFLFVDPARELSIAWFSSEDTPTDQGWMDHVMKSVERIRAAIPI
jgi:CubicO group peptidase (beta-lactamase class C family)